MAKPTTCGKCGEQHWSSQPCAKKAEAVRQPSRSKPRSPPVVAAPVPLPRDLKAMSLDQLREALTAKREAKRLSMARYRAKAKARA